MAVAVAGSANKGEEGDLILRLGATKPEPAVRFSLCRRLLHAYNINYIVLYTYKQILVYNKSATTPSIEAKFVQQKEKFSLKQN